MKKGALTQAPFFIARRIEMCYIAVILFFFGGE